MSSSIPDELLELAIKYLEAFQHDPLTPKGQSDKIYREMLGSYGEIDTKLAIEQQGNVLVMLDPNFKRPVFIEWHVGLVVRR